jgi:hypothetical protein
MLVVTAGSIEAARIDEALQHWRQGDITFEARWFVHAGDGSAALTPASAEATGEGPEALTTEVDGLVGFAVTLSGHPGVPSMSLASLILDEGVALAIMLAHRVDRAGARAPLRDYLAKERRDPRNPKHQDWVLEVAARLGFE